MSQPQHDPQKDPQSVPPPAYGQVPPPQGYAPPQDYAPPQGYLQPQGHLPGAPAPLSPSDERLWGMLAHLAPFAAAFVGVPFVGPLVVFLVYRERSAYVRAQSLESLNFQITLMIGYVIGFVLSFVLIGIPLLILLGVASIVFQIIAAVAANRGEDYRYPATLRLVH